MHHDKVLTLDAADHQFEQSERSALSEAGFHDAFDVLVAYERERARAAALEAQLARFEAVERSTADEL
jgi:hypothetical protein